MESEPKVPEEISGTIFETNEQFRPFEIKLADLMKQWMVSVPDDIQPRIQGIEDTIHAFEDQKQADTKSIRYFEKQDHGDLAKNLYVKFRHFLVVLMEIDQFIGYGMEDEITDEMKRDFRRGVREIRSGMYNDYFRITPKGANVLLRVLPDIKPDLVDNLIEEINSLSVVKSPDIDRPKLYTILDAVKKMSENSEKEMLKKLVIDKLNEADFSMFDKLK